MWSREAFLGEETLLPELPAIGRSRQDSAVGGSLAPHEHAYAYEVVLIESGRLRWWVEKEEYTLAAGALFLTRPGEAHGAVDEVLEPSDIRWAQFRLDLKHAFGLSGSALRAFEERLNHSNRTGRATPSLRHHLKRLLMEHQRKDGRVELIRAHATCLVDDVADALSQPVSSAIDTRIKDALTFMRLNLEKDLSIEIVSQNAGLSPSWFHELFHRHTGMTAGAWLSRERVDKAKILLENHSLSITSIAHDIGFSSSQYFATVFKKQTGQTPREFRSRHVDSSKKERTNR